MKMGNYIFAKEKLSGEYLERLNEIEHYGQVHMVEEEKLAEKMMDLVDLLLETQENGKPAESVLGKNKEDFCKNFYSDVTRKDMLKSLVKILAYFSWLIIGMQGAFTLMVLAGGGADTPGFFYKTDISWFLLVIMVAVSGTLIANFVGIVLLRFKIFSQKIWSIVAIAISVFVMVIGLIMLFFYNVSVTVPLGYIFIVPGSYLFLYYLIIFLCRYRRHGSIKNPKNEYVTSLFGLVKHEINTPPDSCSLRSLVKKYQRKNQKLVKQGKKPWTTETFIEWMKKCYARDVYVVPIFLGFLWAGGILGVFHMLAPEEPLFESSTEACSFVICMVVFVLLAIYFAKFILKKIEIKKLDSIRLACKETGKEIDEYYEFLKEFEKKRGL